MGLSKYFHYLLFLGLCLRGMRHFSKGNCLDYFGQEEGHFCEGRVYFYFVQVEWYFWGEILKKYFRQGEGHFLRRVILSSFLKMWGGSPLLGGNRAFMAEPSDRPAINNGVGGRKK